MVSDYTGTVKRVYQRNSLVSTLRPTLILIQVDMKCPIIGDQGTFLKTLTNLCKQHGIDGIVLRQDEFSEAEKNHI